MKVLIPDVVFEAMMVDWEYRKMSTIEALAEAHPRPTRALRSLKGSFDPAYEGEGN